MTKIEDFSDITLERIFDKSLEICDEINWTSLSEYLEEAVAEELLTIDRVVCDAIDYSPEFNTDSFLSAVKELESLPKFEERVFVTTLPYFRKLFKELAVDVEPAPMFGHLFGTQIYSDTKFCKLLNVEAVFVDKKVYARWLESKKRRGKKANSDEPYNACYIKNRVSLAQITQHNKTNDWWRSK